MKIQRTLFPQLKAHLDQPEITLLVGARQTGKTTLIRALGDSLRERGKRVLMFNLDVERDFAHFQSQDRLLARIRLEVGEERAYVFIDEIQRKENAGLFLKGLYDLDLPYKWIVTGSGSLELKENIHESLLGRKRQFELFPVSLREFIQYRTGYAFEDRLADWFSLEPAQAEALLLEYMNFGGYPRLITATGAEEKQAIIQEIYQSYLIRDLGYLLGLEKPQSFTLLLRLIADRIGQGLNYTDLAQQTGLSVSTVKRYLYYAEKTFVLRAISPFFRNVSKELVKAPQVYFHDLGLRNFSLHRMGQFTNFTQTGFVFQNLVFQLLAQKYEAPNLPLKYWRTKGQAEVDFVLERGLEPWPVEVKCQKMQEPLITRSLRSFIQKYKPKEAWVVNLTLDQEVSLDETNVRFIPWYQIVLT